MPTLKNLNYGPLSVPLGGGETLTLGPQETKEVSEQVVTSEAVQKLVREGALSVTKGRPDVNIPKKK